MRRIMVLAVALLLLFSPYLTTLKAADSATSSVPDFTVHYACDGWGYPWESKTLTVTIQNPPFTANQTSNSELVYSVRCKGHFEDWGSSGGHGVNYLAASKGDYTVITFHVNGWNVPLGGTLDVQVQASIGYYFNDPNNCYATPFRAMNNSGWSTTQTVYIGNFVNPFGLLDLGPELGWLRTLLIIVGVWVFVVVLVVYTVLYAIQKNQTRPQSPTIRYMHPKNPF